MRRAIVVALLLLPLAASAARAEPVTTIANSGDPANRIDVAILGEGYRASELALFAAHARAVVDGMLGRDPFDAYRLYFNVHRVDVVSAQSGADHPELGTSVDTALGATYGCAGIQRLICVDQGKVNAVLQASLPPARSRDRPRQRSRFPPVWPSAPTSSGCSATTRSCASRSATASSWSRATSPPRRLSGYAGPTSPM